jgi:hypothetical protein
MKKKSSVITPPPNMEAGQGSEGNLAVSITDEEKKDALLKLIRKGAPSVPIQQEEEEHLSDRVRFSIRMARTLLERLTRAADDRDFKTPANTWITEAILEKLKKEGF